jgi:hypothetical protein
VLAPLALLTVAEVDDALAAGSRAEPSLTAGGGR